jgi:hypothetical protein
MKSLVTIGLMTIGAAFATMQPAQAAFVLICPSTTCGAAPDTTTFFAGDFELVLLSHDFHRLARV